TNVVGGQESPARTTTEALRDSAVSATALETRRLITGRTVLGKRYYEPAFSDKGRLDVRCGAQRPAEGLFPRARIGFILLVEAAGVEPASGSATGEATPCSASS